MKISLEWISQYVDIAGLEPENIAHELTMRTAEVEGEETIRRFVDGVVVGEIVAVEPVAGGSALNAVGVDCGTQVFRTVCSAPNVRTGLHSAFALPGVEIASGRVAAPSQVDGHLVEGVLCSAKDIGLASSAENIVEIPRNVQKGTVLSTLVPSTDVLLEVDNKSLTHRPDLWGHYGFAREVAAVFGRNLISLPSCDLAKFSDMPAFPLVVEDADACPRYCCLSIGEVTAQPAPLDIQWRLGAVEQSSTNILTDLTNYIAYELGQPMHAFDGRNIDMIKVAPMQHPGVFLALDGVKREMQSSDLMIWNQEEPVAIAGVIGGMSTRIEPDTTSVLLESANFKGSVIRKTAVRLGSRTEASQRFEKNQPTANASLAIERYLYLLNEAGINPSVLSSLTCQGKAGEKRFVSFPAEFIDRKVGVAVPRDRVNSILTSLGFELSIQGEDYRVGIPPHRGEKDISIPEDVLEEITRVYGYDNIVPCLPEVPIDPPVQDEQLQMDHKVGRFLATGHSFVEVHTYSWFDDRFIKRIGFDPGEVLELVNPTSVQERQLRTTLIPNMLAVVEQNLTLKDMFRVFELGHVYNPTKAGSCDESSRLAGVSYYDRRDLQLLDHFRGIKGTLEELATATNSTPLSFEICDKATQPWQMDGQWLAIQSRGAVIGSLGILPAGMLKRQTPRAQIIWFELEVEKLDGSLYPQVQYAPFSPFPESWLDYTLLWDSSRSFKELEQKLDGFEHPLLKHRKFLYYYKGKSLPEGKTSYTFRYWLGAADHTLSGEEIVLFQGDFVRFCGEVGLEIG